MFAAQPAALADLEFCFLDGGKELPPRLAQGLAVFQSDRPDKRFFLFPQRQNHILQQSCPLRGRGAPPCRKGCRRCFHRARHIGRSRLLHFA